ncbi:MAG TPA: DUF2079 domain-containing protein [Patescibacteria group bacterium]|nr:DUF2079 domain-containing protein [Patescibacteria group bacterium]
MNFFAYGFIALYSLAASLVSVHRYWQYEVFYYDFGIFDQAIWNVARFKPPIIDHFVIPGKIIFADHFSPSMFLLTPIYWITSRPESLLIAQAIAVGLSALVLFALGKHVLKQGFAALAVTVSYLLFVGTQNALIADIHEVTFMMLPLMLTLYAVVTKRITLFWVSFLITLGFKESAGLLGLGIAILIFLTNREWRKTAFIVGLMSIAWGILTTQVIIPYFYGRRYFYTPTFDPNPLKVIWTLVDDPIKRKTLLLTFTSFGFLPLFYPAAWPLILQDIAARFMDKDFTLRWGLSLHYSAQMAVILAFSSVMALKKYKKIISIILIILAVYLHQFKLHGPLGLAYNPAFYAHTKNFKFLDDLIARVPKGATVMTMNNIAPHMIHTHRVFLLRAVYDDFMPDYFVLDLRDGQNFNNFFGADIEAVKLTLPRDTRYEVAYQTENQFIYRRKTN